MKIEKNIPMPQKHGNIRAEMVSALLKMEVSDSVLISPKRKPYIISTAAELRRAGKLPSNYRISCRRDEKQLTKVRVWRVE